MAPPRPDRARRRRTTAALLVVLGAGIVTPAAEIASRGDAVRFQTAVEDRLVPRLTGYRLTGVKSNGAGFIEARVAHPEQKFWVELPKWKYDRSLRLYRNVGYGRHGISIPEVRIDVRVLPDPAAPAGGPFGWDLSRILAAGTPKTIRRACRTSPSRLRPGQIAPSTMHAVVRTLEHRTLTLPLGNGTGLLWYDRGPTPGRVTELLDDGKVCAPAGPYERIHKADLWAEYRWGDVRVHVILAYRSSLFEVAPQYEMREHELIQLLSEVLQIVDDLANERPDAGTVTRSDPPDVPPDAPAPIVRPDRPEQPARERVDRMLAILAPLETDLQDGLFQIVIMTRAIEELRAQVLSYQKSLAGDPYLDPATLRSVLAEKRAELRRMYELRDRQVAVTLELMDGAVAEIEAIFHEGGFGELYNYADHVVRVARDRRDLLKAQVLLTSGKSRELFAYTAALRGQAGRSSTAWFLEGLGHVAEGNVLAALDALRESRRWGLQGAREAERRGEQGTTDVGSQVFHVMIGGRALDSLEQHLEILLLRHVQALATRAGDDLRLEFDASIDRELPMEREYGPIRGWLARVGGTGILDAVEGSGSAISEALGGDSRLRARTDEVVGLQDDLAKTHIGIGVVVALRRAGFALEEIASMDRGTFYDAVTETWEQRLDPDAVARLRDVMVKYGLRNAQVRRLIEGGPLAGSDFATSEIVQRIDNGGRWAAARDWAAWGANMVSPWTLFVTFAPSAQFGAVGRFVGAPSSTTLGRYCAASAPATAAVGKLAADPRGRKVLEAAQGVQRFAARGRLQAASVWVGEEAAQAAVGYAIEKSVGEPGVLAWDLLQMTGATSTGFFVDALERLGMDGDDVRAAALALAHRAARDDDVLEDFRQFADRWQEFAGRMDAGAHVDPAQASRFWREFEELKRRHPDSEFTLDMQSPLADARAGRWEAADAQMDAIDAGLDREARRLEASRKTAGRLEELAPSVPDRPELPGPRRATPDAGSPGTLAETPDARRGGTSGGTPDAGTPGARAETPDARGGGPRRGTPDAGTPGAQAGTPDAGRGPPSGPETRPPQRRTPGPGSAEDARFRADRPDLPTHRADRLVIAGRLDAAEVAYRELLAAVESGRLSTEMGAVVAKKLERVRAARAIQASRATTRSAPAAAPGENVVNTTAQAIRRTRGGAVTPDASGPHLEPLPGGKAGKYRVVDRGADGSLRPVAVVKRLQPGEIDAEAEDLVSRLLEAGGRPGPSSRVVTIVTDEGPEAWLITEHFSTGADWRSVRPGAADRIAHKRDLAEDLVYRLLSGDGDPNLGNFWRTSDGELIGIDFGEADVLPTHPKYRNVEAHRRGVAAFEGYRRAIDDMLELDGLATATREQLEEARRAFDDAARSFGLLPGASASGAGMTQAEASELYRRLHRAVEPLRQVGALPDDDLFEVVVRDLWERGLYHPPGFGNPADLVGDDLDRFAEAQLELFLERAFIQLEDADGALRSALSLEDFGAALDAVEGRVAPRIEGVVERALGRRSAEERAYAVRILAARARVLRAMLAARFPSIAP